MKTATLIPTSSAAVDVTSAAFDLGDITVYGVQVIFTGANVVGTLTLEASNNGSNFVTVASSSQAVTASAGAYWSVTGAGYRYVRVAWDYTSGTGNITVELSAKEVRIVGG